MKEKVDFRANMLDKNKRRFNFSVLILIIKKYFLFLGCHLNWPEMTLWAVPIMQKHFTGGYVHLQLNLAIRIPRNNFNFNLPYFITSLGNTNLPRPPSAIPIDN